MLQTVLNTRTVTWLNDGSRTESLLVPGSNVLEIEIEPDLITPSSTTAAEPKQSYIDPAIVSYERKDVTIGQSPRAVPGSDHQEPNKVITNTATSHSTPKPTMNPATISDNLQANSGISSSETFAAQNDLSASATLTSPFNDLSLNGPGDDHPVAHANGKVESLPRAGSKTQGPKTRGKRGGRKIGPKGEVVSTPTQTPSDLGFPTQSKDNRKGWRQTPLLEEPVKANTRLSRAQNTKAPPNLTPVPASRGSKPILDPAKSKRRRYKDEEDQNGWATGEATDIQDMGDFDFEENHKKFDKRKVFDEIRRDDTTADESRLVSFNRLPPVRPGTLGGKNLHYSENVLDSPIKRSIEHSSSDSEVDASETRINSGRSLSRASTRRTAPSRKGSAMAKTSFDRISSPKIKSESSTSLRKTSATQAKPTLLLSQSNSVCPCISPLQMLELEQLAITELGITEDMMTENAARSIAQTAYGLTSPDEVGQATSALIVILAGNNKTGSRAIATGRHLRNHGARVVLCILGLEREDDLIDSVRRQLKIFRNYGGQAIKQDALVRTLRKLQSPTDLIIDALLGIHVSFDDLRSDDQATYFQLVCWANGSDADVLALDAPSGVDASTGNHPPYCVFSPLMTPTDRLSQQASQLSTMQHPWLSTHNMSSLLVPPRQGF